VRILKSNTCFTKSGGFINFVGVTQPKQGDDVWRSSKNTLPRRERSVSTTKDRTTIHWAPVPERNVVGKEGKEGKSTSPPQRYAVNG